MEQQTLLNFPAKVYSWSKEIDTICIDQISLEIKILEWKNGS